MCIQSEMVATVTPLSNNATLASVPNIFEENKLPKDLSLNEMGKIVEECSYNDYPKYQQLMDSVCILREVY